MKEIGHGLDGRDRLARVNHKNKISLYPSFSVKSVSYFLLFQIYYCLVQGGEFFD